MSSWLKKLLGNGLMRFAALAAVFVFGSQPASAAVVCGGPLGHCYEYVSTAVTFSSALSGASSKKYTYNGVNYTGYLATLTSAEESAFIFNNVTKNIAWAGGSDSDVEGTWKWIAGPENGTIFWNNGAAVPGVYSNWGPGEPSASVAGEDFLSINFVVNNVQTTLWNDDNVGNTGKYRGYVIEYGASAIVPETRTWAMMISGLLLTGSIIRRRRTRRLGWGLGRETLHRTSI